MLLLLLLLRWLSEYIVRRLLLLGRLAKDGCRRLLLLWLPKGTTEQGRALSRLLLLLLLSLLGLRRSEQRCTLISRVLSRRAKDGCALCALGLSLGLSEATKGGGRRLLRLRCAPKERPCRLCGALPKYRGTSLASWPRDPEERAGNDRGRAVKHDGKQETKLYHALGATRIERHLKVNL